MKHVTVSLLVVALLALPPPTAAQDPDPNPKRVVALYWYDRGYPSNVRFEENLQRVFESSPSSPVEYHSEYLETSRFPGEAQAETLRDYLRRKYADRPPDVVLAVSPVPLQFLLTFRRELFPTTPLVFYTAAGLEPVHSPAGTALTGVYSPGAYEKTVEMALQLHPATRQVLVVSGTPERDGMIEAQVRQQLRRLEERVAFTYLTDFPLDQLIATVKGAPDDSVILYARQSQDEAGRILNPVDFLGLLARVASVPIYSPSELYVGYGTVGGYVVDLRDGAARTAALALRVARGENVRSLPPQAAAIMPMVDARQLQRWDISEEALPPDSVILYREPTAWDEYKRYLIGSALILFVQAGLIAALLTQRRRRRRTEELLQEATNRYELATTSAGVGVWDWDLATGEIYIDPLLKQILGYEDHEIPNHVDAWGRHVHPEDAPLVQAEVDAHLAGRTPIFEVEHRMVHKDGSIRWFLARGSAVRLPGGQPVRVTGTDTDITERRATESRLQVTQDELSRLSRLTALGEFAASIAHELSQPLSAILMNARASLKMLNGSLADAAEVRAALNDIVDDAARARELMRRNRQLFQYRRVEKSLLDINSIVREVVLFARTRLQNEDVTLTVALDEGLPPVRGDRFELQQVLLNLMLNSIDALTEIRRDSRRIHIASSPDEDGMVTVSLTDTGIGLEGADVGRIFEPMFTTKASGTGIGLSISRSIISAHDGRLCAKANDGGGATFWFTLPAAISPDESQAEPVEAAGASPHGHWGVRT